MQKGSLLFWIIMIGIVSIASYESFFSLSTSTIFIRTLGLVAFFLLSMSLMIGPLATISPTIFGGWIEPRRAVGLSAFAFMVGHFFLVFVHQFGGDFSYVLANVNYAIAIPAMIIFALLSLTSSDAALRKLGFNNWKTIQRLTYVGFVFSLIHYYLSQNGVIVFLTSGKAFFNLAEAGVWVLAVSAILLQVVGFFVKRAKKSATPPVA